ncbi:hypothetical protein EBQ74_01635 [bacterium]|nr:hypothetical protein [bacterium]
MKKPEFFKKFFTPIFPSKPCFYALPKAPWAFNERGISLSTEVHSKKVIFIPPKKLFRSQNKSLFCWGVRQHEESLFAGE